MLTQLLMTETVTRPAVRVVPMLRPVTTMLPLRKMTGPATTSLASGVWTVQPVTTMRPRRVPTALVPIRLLPT